MNAIRSVRSFTLFSCLFCLAQLPITAQAQRKPVDNSPASVDRFITQIMDSANVPGLSIAIIQGNQIRYTQGYGLTKADSTQKVTPETIFDAASLSKPVFAYAVLQLVEQGLLDLDKPLYEYLPYPDAAADERYKKITARLVLSHRSGFPNWRQNRASNQLSMRYAPGERFGYSGEGFVYLQKVVEKLTGKPINETMTERVFRPLQMTRSSYVWTPSFDADFVLPHNTFGQPESKGKPTAANVAYSLQTTAGDYARFILAVMTSKGLKPGTVDQILSRQSQLPKRFSDSDTLSTSLYWGLGFGLEITPTGDYFWHWGDNGSYKAYITADRKRGNAVVYFANGFNGLGFADEVTRRFVGGEHPAPAFLGYDSYKANSSQFARHILDKGVKAALQPYLRNGKSTLTEVDMNWIGEKLINSGRPEEALDVLRYNLEAYPNSASAHASFAYASLYNGKPDEALTYFNQSLTLKPDNAKVKQIVAGLAAGKTPGGTTKLTLSGYPNARLVTLAGSFNDWNELHTFYTKNGDVWECYPDAKPGTYPYKVIVDGKWLLDPGNPTTAKDERGYTNSILVVK